MVAQDRNVEVVLPRDPVWRAAVLDDRSPVVAVAQPARTLADSGVSQALLGRLMAAAYERGLTCAWIAPNAGIARRRLLRWVGDWPAGQVSTPPLEVRLGMGGIVFIDAGALSRAVVDRASLVVVDCAEAAGHDAVSAGVKLADAGRGRCWIVADGRFPRYIPPHASRHEISIEDLKASGMVDERALARIADGPALRKPETLVEWAARYFPHYLRLPMSDLHRYLAETTERMRTVRRARVAVIAPRESAKSTWMSLIGVLDDICHNREPLVWLVSNTSPQAKTMLASVKAELEGNQALAADYPDAVGKGSEWADDSIVTRNGVMVQAFSTGQALRGRRRGAYRPTKIVVDDPQDEPHAYSHQLRRRTTSWFNGALMKAGGPTTNVVVMGNAIHREALVVDLMTRPTWESVNFPEIREWPARMDLWAAWELIVTDASRPASESARLAREFYDANRDAMDEGAVLLWPESKDLYTLMLERVSEGAASFARERQGKPISPDACEWPEEYFGDHIWFDAWPTNPSLKIVVCDPSKGREVRQGDYSAIIRLERSREGLLYVDCDMKRRPVEQIVTDSMDLWEYVRPHAIGFESVAFQSLICSLFETEAARRGFTVPSAAIPCTDPKPMRIRGLGRFLSSRLIRFKGSSPGARMLVDQLRDFPNAAHDDGPDALEMAIRLGADVVGGRVA